MKNGIVILCNRVDSTVPARYLRELAGRTVVGHVLDRVRLGAHGYPIIVAMSDDPRHDKLADYCGRAGLSFVRGPASGDSGLFERSLAAQNWTYGVRIAGDSVFFDTDALKCMLSIAETGMFDHIVTGNSFPPGMKIDIVRTVNEAEHPNAGTSSLPARYTFENRLCPGAADLQITLETEQDFKAAERILGLAGADPSRLDTSKINQLATGKALSNPWRGASGPLLIAEIGGNHEGDFAVARDMAEKAIGSGADCVKFQMYRGESLVSPVESPDRYKHFQRFELEQAQHIELAQMCRDAGVQYLSSVWDMEMLEWIDPYMEFYKIGSGDMTAWPLLHEFARRGKPILLSTGLATLDEVLQAVEQIQSIDNRYTRPEWLCILQCTTMYPIPDDEAQLLVMDALRERTGLSVGYSDHTIGGAAIRTAVSMGADVIEFHFTNSREGKTFRDHKVSLTADEVRTLKTELEQIRAMRGNGIKVPQKSELDNDNGVSFRRAVYARRDIKKGDKITEADLVLLRPLHGTDARDIRLVSGARALKDIAAFEALHPDLNYSSSSG